MKKKLGLILLMVIHGLPVMLYDAKLSQTMADELLKKGVYVIGFFFPGTKG
jgi:7-keto-8-aminopelargonate synthetase-like enzyme